MVEIAYDTRAQLSRQVAHWTIAAQRLSSLEDLAATSAWQGLEHYLGVVVRGNLEESVDRLRRQGALLRAQLEAAEGAVELEAVRRRLLAFREQYLRTETLLEFYSDAINTRTNPTIAALLRACDTLARDSMSGILTQLGRTAPPVLTYIDQGLGASILKSGLRLWDGRTESRIAAIKVVRHNLYRPTALIHEAGHQIAHICGWNEELAGLLRATLEGYAPLPARVWGSWASEIAADAIAFAYTGYASIASLHDVLAGDRGMVFGYIPGDPHPVAFLRVLLGVEMCRLLYGRGLWDDLAASWTASHPLDEVRPRLRQLFNDSLPLLPLVARTCLATPMASFGGRSLISLVDPMRVSPAELRALEQRGGGALFTSSHWVSTESLRLLALTGYSIASEPERSEEIIKTQELWMKRLGNYRQPN